MKKRLAIHEKSFVEYDERLLPGKNLETKSKSDIKGEISRAIDMKENMKWISDRKPNTPGLYGVLINDQRWNPDCFIFGYWDGKGWKIPSQSDIECSPYRGNPTWCKLEIGTD